MIKINKKPFQAQDEAELVFDLQEDRVEGQLVGLLVIVLLPRVLGGAPPVCGAGLLEACQAAWAVRVRQIFTCRAQDPTQVWQHGGLQAVSEGGGGVMELQQRVEALLLGRPLQSRAQAHGDGGHHVPQSLDQQHRHHLCKKLVFTQTLVVQCSLCHRPIANAS
ncbi:hypothetical protein F7725_014183 [Dissostichus mawsoni]|uniref:Uncharacterized protein n=1 Tax=Dissostichus mawsoni TaxID=36200 RepID=A0A7J5YVF9_DISMA|nr:hypothetical protein F7725_014183 [Dissostichus mawsoni]